MRQVTFFELKLSLRPTQNLEILDTYRTQVQGMIYDFISKHNPQYSAFLHDEGYLLLNGNQRVRLKSFVFSGLYDSLKQHPRRVKGKDAYFLEAYRHYHLTFRSSKSEFIEAFLYGTFKQMQQHGHQIRLGTCKFEIANIELLGVPPVPETGEVELHGFHSGNMELKHLSGQLSGQVKFFSQISLKQ